jgi:cytoskeletal protein RodZ
MKNGSKFLRLTLVGMLGAAVMIGCSDEPRYSEESSVYDENGCKRVFNEEIGEYEDVCDGPTTVAPGDDSVPVEETTTTVEETTTTVEETTTTTVPRPTTTVKKTTAATAPPTHAPVTHAPTTQAPTTAPTTQAPTTAPPTTLPPVNVSYMWSPSSSGCNVPYSSFYLMVDVTGATSAGTISVSVNGQSVSSYGGPTTFAVGDTSYIMFDQWPILSNGTYPVTITATSATQGPTVVTTSVTYNCP